VNNVGEQEYPGTLEVAADSLKFYINGSFPPIIWPYKIMKYIMCGESMYLFSIGSGKSSPYANEDGFLSFETDEALTIFGLTSDK